jgi:ATP-binding cassette subfamily F protein uup
MDQARSQLQENISLREFLCPHGDSIVYRNESIHIAAWASRFLFTHNHLSAHVSSLSGGERARALLAKSMAEECDILLFDEPTNDLDIATLETLEESFESFPGAIVLITHDRYLLDRAANQVLGIASGQATLCAQYAQWEEFRASAPSTAEISPEKSVSKQPPGTTSPKKLSYKDARDLATIEQSIQTAEGALATTQAQIDSGTYATDATKLSELCDALTLQQAEVDRLYERWQQLETLRALLCSTDK